MTCLFLDKQHLSLSFCELLALHMERMRDKKAAYLFESVRKHKYTDRGLHMEHQLIIDNFNTPKLQSFTKREQLRFFHP